jgi:hypothetical protein
MHGMNIKLINGLFMFVKIFSYLLFIDNVKKIRFEQLPLMRQNNEFGKSKKKEV